MKCWQNIAFGSDFCLFRVVADTRGMLPNRLIQQSGYSLNLATLAITSFSAENTIFSPISWHIQRFERFSPDGIVTMFHSAEVNGARDQASGVYETASPAASQPHFKLDCSSVPTFFSFFHHLYERNSLFISHTLGGVLPVFPFRPTERNDPFVWHLGFYALKGARECGENLRKPRER